MNRLLLWTIALVVAAAPAAADMCRLDCGRDRPPACPLHQQAPHPCAHDHSVSAADPAHARADAPRPTVDAIAVAPDAITRRCAIAAARLVEHHHTPPLRSARADVLRI